MSDSVSSKLKIVFETSWKFRKSISLKKITMKKLIVLFGIFSGVMAYSQTTVKTSDGEVYEMVDKAAEFPGGIHSFRAEFAKNIDVNKITGKGTFSTEITFVVERDGRISSLKAVGQNQSFNEQAVRAIKKITTKWSAAKVNNVPVRSRYRFPARANI